MTDPEIFRIGTREFVLIPGCVEFVARTIAAVASLVLTLRSPDTLKDTETWRLALIFSLIVVAFT